MPENQSLAEYLQNQNPQQDQPNENIISGLEESVPAEEVQIDSHESNDEGIRGMLKRAGENLKNTLTDPDPTPTRRGRPSGSKANKEDFSVLVVSVVTLLVTFAKVDERVKPNKSEIDLFSDHLSGILLRHLPINNKLSADALDIIGIMAVSASWYSRVHDDLVPLTITAQQSPAQTIPVYKKNGHAPAQPVTPLQDASPEDKAFLDEVARNHTGEE